MRYTSFTCGFLFEVFSISYLKQIADCLKGVCNLSVTWFRKGGLAVVCWGYTLKIPQSRFAVACRGCTLSFTWCTVALICWGVLCQLHELSWRLSAGAVWTVSVIEGRLGVVCRWCVHCQLLTAGWLLSTGGYSVSYMMQIGDCMQAVCELCQLHNAGWWFSVGGVSIQLVTWGMWVVVCRWFLIYHLL